MDRKFQMQDGADGLWSNNYPCVKADCLKGIYGTVDGNGGTYTITLEPAPEEYVQGMIVFGRILKNNNSTTVKLKINNLNNPNLGVQGQDSWIPVKKKTGSKAFVANEIQTGMTLMFLYDGLEWVLL